MSRASVLDLTLATEKIANTIKDWQIIDTIGSDHSGLLFTIVSSKSPTTDNIAFNLYFYIDKANWDLFTSTL